jgi:hypothetical protein
MAGTHNTHRDARLARKERSKNSGEGFTVFDDDGLPLFCGEHDLRGLRKSKRKVRHAIKKGHRSSINQQLHRLAVSNGKATVSFAPRSIRANIGGRALLVA